MRLPLPDVLSGASERAAQAFPVSLLKRLFNQRSTCSTWDS